MDAHRNEHFDSVFATCLRREPIAIVGIGCRFSCAHGPEQLWHSLRAGKDLLRDMPAGRFDPTPYQGFAGDPGRIATVRGGFLDGIDLFDAEFFNVSPREAVRLDPQQRLILEVGAEALEDAGQNLQALAGTRTGVFIGVCSSEHEALHLYRMNPAVIDIYCLVGDARNVIPGRLSFSFGLQGPSVAVDSACSSSLVAAHLACQSLLMGDCTMALAGGVNVILAPNQTIGFSRAKMLSPDGRCKAFDASADGFVRSEGAGVVVLKRLSDAQSDGDRIYAVILGGSANNCGRTSGYLMTPSVAGQTKLLRQAYEAAHVDPRSVQYVEAHGAGTPKGDRIEAQALAAVLCQHRALDQSCCIGSIKTNIGHTEAAAGVAGLIKTALSISHRELPPSLNFETPNPEIPFEQLGLRVQTQLEPWPNTDGPARAGVSGFGISGTNVHLILEEAPAQVEVLGAKPNANGPYLLPFSAHTRRSLLAGLERFRDFLADLADPFADVVYTASARRAHRKHRFAIVTSSAEDARHQIDEELRSADLAIRARDSEAPPRIAFVFPGQGSQWYGMGRELLAREKVFRTAIEECDGEIAAITGWSLIDLLENAPDDSWQSAIDRIQPALFAIQVGLARLWKAWGVRPRAVIGQSMGEVAAAHISGAISLADACAIICRRSRLLLRKAGQGAMASIGLSLDETRSAIAPYSGFMSVAVSASPDSTVVSGDPTAIEQLLGELERRDIFCRSINVTVASHSPQMDSLKHDLLAELSGLRPQACAIPLFSTVRAQRVEGPDLDASYWVDNLREPVLFAPTILALLRHRIDTFVEVSPHPVALQSVQQCSEHAGVDVRLVPSIQRNGDESTELRRGLAELYMCGQAVDWIGLFPKRGRCVSLPSYSWDRQRYWAADDEFVTPATTYVSGHPLLGARVDSPTQPGTYQWTVDLQLARQPFFEHHRVQGSTILPAAAYCEMALQAASELFGPGGHELADVTFESGLFVEAGKSGAIRLTATMERADAALFQFHMRPAGAAPNASWTLLCSGLMRQGEAAQNERTRDLDAIRSRCSAVMPGAEHYSTLHGWGLQYGPAFQGVWNLWRSGDELLAELKTPNEVAQDQGYVIHPSLLDSAFQPLVHAYGGPCLPQRIVTLRPYGPGIANAAWSHIQVDPANQASEHRSGRISLLDETGHELLNLRLELRGIEGNRGANSVATDGWLVETKWVEAERAGAAPRQRSTWLILADAGGVGEQVATVLERLGHTCVLVFQGDSFQVGDGRRYRVNGVREDWAQLFEKQLWAELPPIAGVIQMWSLDSRGPADTATIETALERGCLSTHALVQELVRRAYTDMRLLLVTASVQRIAPTDRPSVAQAPLWGVGRCLAYEHPEFPCTNIDLSEAAGADEIAALVHEIQTSASTDDRVALRRTQRYVAHLAPYSASEAGTSSEPPLAVQQPKPYYLDIPFGVLDNFKTRAVPRPKPSRGEVEIEVAAAGIIFYDLMRALNIYPGPRERFATLGAECAGRITAVGEGVTEFQLGDSVVAVSAAPRGCFRSHVIIPAVLVRPKPPGLSDEEAAGLPVAYMTAIYSLVHQGRISASERVLIHSATGGAGLAAIDVARRAGAEVFATAGTPEKREYLRSIGIRHIMDSRSLDFAREIMEITGGDGVDLVYNSLTGEAIAKNLSILRPYGRYLEIGKKDVYADSRIGLRALRNNASFAVIDLDGLVRERLDLASRLLSESMPYMDQKMPVDVYPVDRANEAFQTMARARHIGKIIISFRERPATLYPPPGRADVRGDGTYLITGGLGGLGLEIAAELVAAGAKHLVLVGRRAPSVEGLPKLDALRRSAVIETRTADVSCADDVRKLVAEITEDMPPLRGLVHAAGVLSDELLMNLTPERFREPLGSKIAGAWNLHTATLDQPLDFFVLFSSAAALVGSPGQSNYAAGNAFLDALAHYRRGIGLCAQSINWGPWSEVGLAARADRGTRLENRGLESMSPAQGRAIFRELLEKGPVQAGAIKIDLAEWSKYYPASARSAFFSELRHGAHETQSAEAHLSSVRETIAGLADEARIAALARYLKEQIARVLRLPAARVAELDADQTLNRLGVDSLMAVELRNRIDSDIGVAMPVIKLLQRPTISDLAGQIAAMLPTEKAKAAAASANGSGSSAASTATSNGQFAADQEVLARLDQMSEQAMDELLDRLLAE